MGEKDLAAKDMEIQPSFSQASIWRAGLRSQRLSLFSEEVLLAPPATHTPPPFLGDPGRPVAVPATKRHSFLNS